MRIIQGEKVCGGHKLLEEERKTESKNDRMKIIKAKLYKTKQQQNQEGNYINFFMNFDLHVHTIHHDVDIRPSEMQPTKDVDTKTEDIVW